MDTEKTPTRTEKIILRSTENRPEDSGGKHSGTMCPQSKEVSYICCVHYSAYFFQSPPTLFSM